MSDIDDLAVVQRTRDSLAVALIAADVPEGVLDMLRWILTGEDQPAAVLAVAEPTQVPACDDCGEHHEGYAGCPAVAEREEPGDE